MPENGTRACEARASRQYNPASRAPPSLRAHLHSSLRDRLARSRRPGHGRFLLRPGVREAGIRQEPSDSHRRRHPRDRETGRARELPADRLRPASARRDSARSAGVRQQQGRRRPALGRDDGVARGSRCPHGHVGVVSAGSDGADSGPRTRSFECSLRVRRGGPGDTDAAAGLRAAQDQPLPRGGLPRLQEDRQHDRPHPHLVLHTGARSVHGARHKPSRLREPRRRPSACLCTLSPLLRAQRPPAPGTLGLGLSETVGRRRLGRHRKRHRSHPAAAVLPAHGEPSRDRQVGERPASGRAAARRSFREPRARPNPQTKRAVLTRADVPRSQSGQGPDVDPAHTARPDQSEPRPRQVSRRGGSHRPAREVHRAAEEADREAARGRQGEGAGRQRLGLEGRR